MVSFRGTNDNGKNNPDDPANNIHPDKDQWTDMDVHYGLLQPLIDAVDAYAVQPGNGISKIFVTGHSLGGAMAINYLETHAGSMYEGVSFAAPPFATSSLNTIEYGVDRGRLIQMEVAGDSVPMTHEMGPNAARPGYVIKFEGSGTVNRPDYHAALGIFAPFYGNDNSHSMDYYRQITRSVDSRSWNDILLRPNGSEVLLGAQVFGSQFIVDGVMSGTGDLVKDEVVIDAERDILLASINKDGADYNVFYGGIGDDYLGGDSTAELMLGGIGQDTIFGGAGSDTLTGGGGFDVFRFVKASEGGDIIADFFSGTDKIQVVSSNFAALPVGVLSSARFLAGSNPAPINSNAVFLYNTSTGVLTFDSNGSGLFGTTTLATLTGSRTLVAGDIQVVAA